MNRIEIKRVHTISWLIVLALAAVLLIPQNGLGQINRRNHKNNFSSLGKSMAVIRHGLTIQAFGFAPDNFKPFQPTVAIGVGYTATQYYGVGNRFMQQSVVYSLGLCIDKRQDYFIHSLSGTFHCSFIGNVDLNPFIYGIALQIVYAPRTQRSDYLYNEASANFYVRPEIGFTFPAKYRNRTKEVQRVTGSITYGFSIGTFYNTFNREFAKKTEQSIWEPFTHRNHHVITLRLNINFTNMREMRK